MIAIIPLWTYGTNAGIVSDAIKSMERKREQLDTMQKIDERIEEKEEEKTTTGIF